MLAMAGQEIATVMWLRLRKGRILTGFVLFCLSLLAPLADFRQIDDGFVASVDEITEDQAGAERPGNIHGGVDTAMKATNSDPFYPFAAFPSYSCGGLSQNRCWPHGR